ncbi:uncharacterized protein [Ptychodera flava]|uniref:uncharacterized protein n=1 Tax=Ptychodera flava TaxID=63121 RepID=UPI003969FDC2
MTLPNQRLIMESERPEEKEDADPTGKGLTQKMIERVVTLLFIFTSWITSKYNTPGLTKRIVTDFCKKYAFSSPSQNICCTVIDVEVSDDEKENARSAGVTLIPARRKQSLDPQRHPPNLDWLLQHETYYPELGKLENVKYVVGHDSMTSDAARDIRNDLFPDAVLYLLKANVLGVLVVFDNWDIGRYGLAEFHRNLMKIFATNKGKGFKVYATILDVTISEAQREDAEKAGITLIPARRAEHLDPEDDPINIRWLSYPESHYPELSGLPNIQYVIGYAPMTAKAAANIHRTLFPQAKLYQINAIHPDYHATMTSEAQSKLEGDMLKIAKEADAMVSIGPSMHAYFENAYRAIPERTIPHIELLPKVGECFQKQAIEAQENIPQHVILSYGELDCHADIISDYSKIASELGKVAAAQDEVCGHSIKWNILDGPTESVEATENDLNKVTLCNFEFAKLKPTATISQLLTHFQQSHLCIMCSRRTDFGFYGLESIAAGLPTYVYRDSQLGAFITKYLKAYKDLFLVRSEQECHDKVMAAIKDTDTALKWASELKKAYLECKEVDQSYSRFAALFTDEKEPSEDLAVTIELNTQPWKQRLKELKEQREMVLRQRPDDQPTLDALTQAIQEVNESLQSLKRKADQMIEDESAKLKRLCCDANVGVNQVTNVTKGSLAMLLNFLSILGLYRFKSSVQTGRFADLYEPWLITDEMREIAAKVNLPLKLQVTYDEKRFRELDAFFIKREFLHICLSFIEITGKFSYTLLTFMTVLYIFIEHVKNYDRVT